MRKFGTTRIDDAARVLILDKSTAAPGVKKALHHPQRLQAMTVGNHFGVLIKGLWRPIATTARAPEEITDLMAGVHGRARPSSET